MNAQSLLDALLQAGPAGSTHSRLNHALGPQGLGGGGSPLGGILGDLLQQAGGMLSAGRDKVAGGDPAAIGGLGALAGALLGGRSGALGGGALALLGSLAFSALRSASGNTAPVSAEQIAREAPIGLKPATNAAEKGAAENTARLIITAMVSAAKADGAIDGGEMERLMRQVKEAGADADDQAFLLGELQKPLDLEGLIRSVTTPEAAAQVYAASVLAIEIDTAAEKDYLQRLAAGLDLPPQAVAEIHAALGVTS
ncbi:MAG: tellurite resistance TerB family protein [Rhodospirillales bacterium]|nr:tellurite resistance TerB family protein [Rhodospirillales bacterium]